MKIGYLQFSPCLGEVDKTIEKIEHLLAGIGEIDLVVLPELANSGYNFSSRDQAFACSQTLNNSNFIDFLIEKCRKHNSCFVTGFNERNGSKIFNSSVLLTREGVRGTYRKIHLFMNEKDYFARGDLGVQVFDIGLCRISMLICFDWMFPEVWRIAGIKHADIVCHPANLVIPGKAQAAVPVHAMINRFFVITANRTGSEGGLTFTGRSGVFDPTGQALISSSDLAEEIVHTDIDVYTARKKMITEKNHVFRDRRPSEYADLLKSD